MNSHSTGNEDIPDWLMEMGRKSEKESFKPDWKKLDGSPYSAFLVDEEFFSKARSHFGRQALRDEIRALMDINHLADENCGNWTVWMIFVKMGIARDDPLKNIYPQGLED